MAKRPNVEGTWASDLSAATGLPVTDVADPVAALLDARARAVPPPFTSEQRDAVRRILDANDAQPDRRNRVTAPAALKLLQDHFGYKLRYDSFRKAVLQTFGRHW